MKKLQLYFSKKILILALSLFILAAAIWGSYINYYVNPKIDKFFYGTINDRQNISVELKKLNPFYIKPLGEIMVFSDSATFADGMQILMEMDPTLLNATITSNAFWFTHPKARNPKPPGIGELIAASKTLNPQVRVNVAKTLGEIGDTAAFETLKNLLEDETENVQTAAIKSLAKLGDKRAVALLMEKYEDFKKTKTSAIDFVILKALHDLNETRFAAEILEDPKKRDMEVYLTAANIIAEIDKKLDLAPLFEHLYKTHGTFPPALVQSLIKIDKRSVESYYYNIRRIGIRSSYTKEQKIAFAISSTVLSYKGNEKMAKYLMRFFKSNYHEIAAHAISAAGKIRNPNVSKTLLDYLKHRNESVQLAAINVIAESKDTSCITEITKLTSSEKENVKKAAFNALLQIDESASIDFLLKLLEKEHTADIVFAAQALGSIGDSIACKPLINKLDYYDEDVVEACIFALGKIGDSKACKPLINKLNYYNEDVVEACIFALGEIGDIQAKEPVFETFKNTMSTELSTAAALVLGKLGDERAIHECKRILLVGRKTYQEQAAEALVAIGNKQVLKELTKTLRTNHLIDKKILVANIINTIKNTR